MKDTIYIGDVYIDIRMKYIYIVTYNHEELYGEIHLFIIVESICMIMEKYLHICWRHIYILVIECWTYSVTTFRGTTKPPTYLLYMRELTHNDGSFYIYIYIIIRRHIYKYICTVVQASYLYERYVFTCIYILLEIWN